MKDDFSRPPARPAAKLDQLRDLTPGVAADPEVIKPTSVKGSAFKTPEEVSATTETQADFLPPLEKPNDDFAVPVEDDNENRFIAFVKNLSKKQWAMIAVVALLIIGGGTTFALTHKKAQPAKQPVAAVKPKPVPKPILSPLSGLPVKADVQARPVTGVMIENSPDARPQSGLDQASIVFEAIAEAGITRFLALFQDNYPETLGPVRSSRPYYLDWAMAFDASYAHVGGSPDALQRIKDIGVKDLDQFFNPGPYHRVSSRFAPHNMYTSLQALVDAGNAKGYTKSTFTPLVRKTKESPSKTPNAKSIDFSISGPTYNVHYDYDAASNTYKRSEGGESHVDNETKAQLSPKVVIALAMPYNLMADGYHSDYLTTGSGNMFVFQDGIVTPGTWSKAGPKEQFVFKGSDNADLKLNPGQTWITVLDDISKATYQP